MPLINGKKMACEPCIRGHRSTSCNHARERVMVPVRKPGRPLNECPHPRGSGCHCRDLTVAIPRKRKCACIGDQPPQDLKSSPSPTAAFRPGSTTPTVLEQSKVNGESATSPSSGPRTSSATPTGPSNRPLNGGTGAPWNGGIDWGFATTPTSEAVAHFQGFTGPVPPTLTQQATAANGTLQSKAEADGRTSHGNAGTRTPTEEAPAVPSCCSRRSSSMADFVATPGAVSPESSASSYTDHSRSSSKSAQLPQMKVDRQNSPRMAIVPQLPTNAVGQTPYPMVMPNAVSQLGQLSMQPITANPPACTNCGHHQPAILIYLPYNLPAHPVNYVGPAGPVFIAQPNGTNISAHSAVELPRNVPAAVTVPVGGCSSDPNGLTTIHECNCGPGCACIGCIAHPFNEATKEYIRSAQDAFEDFGGPAYPAVPDLDGAAIPSTQSMASLSMNTEQILAPEDFFFVDYSMNKGAYPG